MLNGYSLCSWNVGQIDRRTRRSIGQVDSGQLIQRRRVHPSSCPLYPAPPQATCYVTYDYECNRVEMWCRCESDDKEVKLAVELVWMHVATLAMRADEFLAFYPGMYTVVSVLRVYIVIRILYIVWLVYRGL